MYRTTRLTYFVLPTPTKNLRGNKDQAELTTPTTQPLIASKDTSQLKQGTTKIYLVFALINGDVSQICSRNNKRRWRMAHNLFKIQDHGPRSAFVVLGNTP